MATNIFAEILQWSAFQPLWQRDALRRLFTVDVVDNLWVAVWFATNSIGPADRRSRLSTPRTTGSGWIYFIAATEPTNSVALDLREVHHGLSLRPHAQSGWSVRSTVPDGGDLGSSVIGCVEFPITKRWAFGGHLGSSEFLFPSRTLDDTLHRLIEHDGDALAATVERESRVPNGTLGRLYEVKDAAV